MIISSPLSRVITNGVSIGGLSTVAVTVISPPSSTFGVLSKVTVVVVRPAGSLASTIDVVTVAAAESTTTASKSDY